MPSIIFSYTRMAPRLGLEPFILAMFRSKWQHHHQSGTAIPKHSSLQALSVLNVMKGCSAQQGNFNSRERVTILHHLVKLQTSAREGTRCSHSTFCIFSWGFGACARAPDLSPTSPCCGGGSNSPLQQIMTFLIDTIFPLMYPDCIFTAHACKDCLEEP